MTLKNKNNINNYCIFVAIILGLAFFIFPFHLSYGQNDKLNITHGVASGDVKNDSAIIWSRSNSDSIMNVQYSNGSNFDVFPSNNILKTTVNSSTNYTGHIKLTNLEPSTTYYYKVWFSGVNDSSILSDNKTGKFKTAPNKDSPSGEVNFVIGGDLGGSKLCKQQGIGYPIFSIMRFTNPDFFIFNGDQIYADYECPSDTKNDGFPFWKNIPGNFSSVDKLDWDNNSTLYREFLKHWEYNRADTHLQNLLNYTSLYSQGDDHEVTDNYGGLWKFITPSYKQELHNKTGYQNLVKTGMDVFFKFSPIEKNQTEPGKIYRMFNWGKDLDLFLLDAHSYRSLNNLEDTAQNNKTLYGKHQLNWLKSGLLSSDATWKIISNPIPITIPECFGSTACNNWATNSSSNNLTFTKERNEFLKFLDEENVKNVVFITTDIHFAGTVKVVQDFDGDGETFVFYEMASGPLGTNTQDKTNPVDPTINAKYLYSENAIFNFGHIKLKENSSDKKMHLVYEVVDSNGRIRPSSSLDLPPMS